MATVPGVYVTIEDRSYIQESPPSGRTGLITILSDRGRHNRVVEVTSQSQFLHEFGKPNMERTGQAHYLAMQFLKGSNRLFVIRASLLDSSNPEHNQSIANAVIKYAYPGGSEELADGDFIFVNSSDALTTFGDPFISNYVLTNYIGYKSIEVNDYIYNYKDRDTSKQKVLLKDKLCGTDESDSVYYLKLDNQYSGSSSIDTDHSNKLLISYTPSVSATPLTDLNSYIAELNNMFVDKTYIVYDNISSLGSSYTYKFSNGSNIVYANDLASYNKVNSEDWIYPASIVTASSVINDYAKYFVQIVDKEIITSASGISSYQLKLNTVYSGVSTTTFEEIYSFNPFYIDSYPFIKKETSFTTDNLNNLFYFYAIGTGSYYNKIFLRASRNVQLEKMYTDDNGVVKYKYLFMDLTVYGENEDGSNTVLEGPWTVSLIDKINDNIVRDIHTGRELYIVKTINRFSNYIKCTDTSFASDTLSGEGDSADNLRLQIMSLFSEAYVTKTNTRGKEGFYLENGSDGNQYDAFKRLNLYNNEIQTLIRSAYSTILESVDGTIELLQHTLYPWYQIDYVIAGGYSINIQTAARTLVDVRNDCLLLADTGQSSINAREDINIRDIEQLWNTWNAAIYTQYSEITDPYSGNKIWITPVYHAIYTHLFVDSNYFLSEPPAGIVKGSLQEAAKLMYKPNLTDMEDMIDKELNPIITEPDGTYFITQFTAYKRLSVMKRQHAVKFVHYIRKNLPRLLKGLLQFRATPYWLGVANTIVNTFMKPFSDFKSNVYSVSTYSCEVMFDEERSEMFISLTIKPLRAIEAIHLNIIVT